MKNTLKRSLALLLVLLFAIPTFAFAEDLGVEAVSVEDIALVEDVATDDVVVEQAEEPVEEDNLDLAEANTILGEEFAETNEVEELAETNEGEGSWTIAGIQNADENDAVPTLSGTTLTFTKASGMTAFVYEKQVTPARPEGYAWFQVKFTAPTPEIAGTAYWAVGNGDAVKASAGDGQATTVDLTAGTFTEWFGVAPSDVKTKSTKSWTVKFYNVQPEANAEPDATFTVEVDLENITLKPTAAYAAELTTTDNPIDENYVFIKTLNGEVVEENNKGDLLVEFVVDGVKMTAADYTTNYTNVVKGSKISKPTEPTSTNKFFDGWYIDDGFNTKFDFTTAVVDNMTLYGQFLAELTVTFKKDDLAATTATAAATVPFGKYLDPAEEAVTWATTAGLVQRIPTVPDMKKDGYSLVVDDATKEEANQKVIWFDDPEAGNEIDLDREPIVENLTLYPHYTPWETTIKFVTDDDTSSVSDMVVKYGEYAVEPVPTKSGAEFEGWYYEKVEEDYITTGGVDAKRTIFNPTGDKKNTKRAHTGKLDFDKAIDLWDEAYTPYADAYDPDSADTVKNVVYVTAKFNTNQYKVFFMNGETGRKYTQLADVPANTTLAKYCTDHSMTEAGLKPTTTEGKAFGGWYTDSTLTVPFKFETDKITADKTEVWAKIETATYEVAFDSDGGSPVATQTVEYNTTADEPADPTKEGYVFGGWYEGSSKFSFSTRIKRAYNLKARWTPVKVTVTYEGEGLNATTYRKRTVNWGTASATVKPTAPTRNGYRFLGWFVGDQEYTFEDKLTADLTLTAGWQKQYKITFVMNGGAPNYNPIFVDDNVAVTEKLIENMLTHNANGEANAVAYPPAKTGYTLDTWYADKDLKTPYAFGSVLTENITLYAGYTASYTVTLKRGSGLTDSEWNTVSANLADSIKTQNVKRGDYAKDPGVLENVSGKAFKGWFADKEGKTAFNFSTTAINAATEVFAVYEKATTKKVTIKYNGTDMVFTDSKLKNPQEVVSGECAVAPSAKDMAKEGKTFVGFFKGNTPFEIESTPITADTTLYARYTDDTYKVNFVIGDETIVTLEKTLGEMFSYKELKPIDDAIKAKGITVTKWTYNDVEKKYNPSTGEFDEKEKTSVLTYTYVDEEEETVTTNVISAWELAGEKCTFQRDTTITATYSATKYDVIFDTNGGTPAIPAQKVEHGKTATAPTVNPTKTGMVFVGWYYMNEKGKEVAFDFSTPITDDIVDGEDELWIWAKYKQKATVSVSMKGWAIGEKANDPVVSVNPSEVADFAVVEYKLSTADDSTYTPTKPTTGGTYTVRVSLENDTYKAVPDTATFTIAAAAVTDPSKEFVTTVTTEANGDVVVTVTKDGKEVSKVTAKPGEAASSDEIKITQKVNADGTVTVTIEPGTNASYTFPAYTVTSTTSIQLPVPAISSLKCAKKRKVTVSWTALTDIDGYEIVWGKTEAAAKKMTPVDVPGATTASKKVKVAKKLKGKKVLFFIRSYKTVGGQKIYSAWSASKKSGKIKK